MVNITLETQLKALYNKAQMKKQEAQPSRTNDFDKTLEDTIKRMHDISDQADKALEKLSSEGDKATLDHQIAHADSIHQQIMEEQHNLSDLYGKLNDKQKKS